MEQREHKLLSEFDPTPSKYYYVYVLKNIKTRELYYGYTNDLIRRLSEHNNDSKIWDLIYFEGCKAESDARRRERQLKNHAQALTALKGRIRESLK